LADDTSSARVPVGLLILGVTTTISYAAQRLWAAASPIDNLDASIVQAVHIPYYWRCATALFHGTAAAVLTAWGLDEPQAARLLSWGPWIVAVAVIPSALAMLVVP